MDRDGLTVTYRFFRGATLTTFSASNDGRGNVVGADVGIAIADLSVDSGEFSNKAVIILDQSDSRVWLAHYVKPEWSFDTVPEDRKFRWTIQSGLGARLFSIIFQCVDDLSTFTEMFQEARELALLAELAGDRLMDEVLPISEDRTGRVEDVPAPPPTSIPMARARVNLPEFPTRELWKVLHALGEIIVTPTTARRVRIIPTARLLSRFMVLALMRTVMLVSHRLVYFLQQLL